MRSLCGRVGASIDEASEDDEGCDEISTQESSKGERLQPDYFAGEKLTFRATAPTTHGQGYVRLHL